MVPHFGRSTLCLVLLCVGHFALVRLSIIFSKIVYGRILATANFHQWFHLLSEILWIFHRNFVWNGEISRSFCWNIGEISAIFSEDKERISPNFVCITFSQYGIHPHPRPPATSLAMAGFLFLAHAKTVLLQDYQIQLQLRSVELHCGLRENVISIVNSMDVLEKSL